MEKLKLENIIKNSKTISESIKKLGLRAAGGNYNTIKKYIKKYNIDITHFDGNSVRLTKLKENTENRKFPLNEILINGSSYNRGHLKERLYKEGLKERKCELCGQDEIWNNKKMSLILDHKNGIWNDNRINNLQIVCPNCNATLDTHCGKNKPQKITIKSEENKRKNKINSAIKRRKVNRPELIELLNDVNKFGYSATGRKYNVSDNAIRKWIKMYQK